MEIKTISFFVVVAVLGIISAATGFAAEATATKSSDVYIEDDTCVYPSSPALALGFISIIFAIITRIYVSVTFGGCSCCRKDDSYSTMIPKILYILSWVASVVAVVLLLAAATLNNEAGGDADSYGYVITCYVVKPGIYAAGAVLALLSAVFGVAAYITLLSATQLTTDPTVATDVELEKSPMYQSPQQHP
nr:hypothetical protein CTI12_AA593210 [Tanacetum cinerariifolium]